MSVDLSRVRKLPRGFGWVDARVVHEGHLAGLGPVEVVVYLALCVVADRAGVSWYRPETLARHVHHPADRVRDAIKALVRRGLIASEGRYVQVLDLDASGCPQGPGPDQANRGHTLELGQASGPAKPGCSPELGPVQSAESTVSPGCSPEMGQGPDPLILTAQEFLAALPASARDAALDQARAHLCRVVGRRPPSPSVVMAVAASFARRGRS